MNEWNIQSRSHGCQSCHTPFVDKQSYHTLLFDDKNQYTRQDICNDCWNAQYGAQSEDKRPYVSYWQGVYHKAPPAPPEAIQKDTAESLLRKLIELNDVKYTAAGYILAVMLERKKLLKIKEQFSRDGHRVFIYEHPRSGDFFTIVDPALQLNQLDEVQRMVSELLEHGLRDPATDQNQEAIPALSPEAPPPVSPAEEPDTNRMETPT